MPIGKRDEERRQARNQVMALGMMIGAALGATMWAKHAPADASELRIVVGELRSQAAELEVLGEEDAAGKLDAPFVREHARQLAKINENSLRELARLRVEHGLEMEKSLALAAGGELVTQISALGSGQPAGSQTKLRDIRHQLQNRESALRP